MKREWLVFLMGLAVLVFGSAFFITSTPVNSTVTQPIAFKHSKHTPMVECAFCHQSVKDSAAAGIPQAPRCMTCHSAPVTQNPEAQKIKSYFESGEPIPWVRMFRLANDLMFNHKAHVGQGIECQTCHGSVATQEAIPAGFGRQGVGGPYGRGLMDFCLSCHRQQEAESPGRNLPDCLTCHE